MSRCAYCGQEQEFDFENHHFHGSIPCVCPYGNKELEPYVNCKSKWQNFKIRIKKFQSHRNPELSWFADFVARKVFEEKIPAILFDKQLQIMRKRADKELRIMVKKN